LNVRVCLLAIMRYLGVVLIVAIWSGMVESTLEGHRSQSLHNTNPRVAASPHLQTPYSSYTTNPPVLPQYLPPSPHPTMITPPPFVSNSESTLGKSQGGKVYIGGNCTSSPCRNGGTCIANSISYICQCGSTFYGPDCENSTTDSCASNPCKNGATCVNGASGYLCICAFGYTGGTCQSTRYVCSWSPCMNGGTCINDTALSYHCQCPFMYSGAQCDIRDPRGFCASSPCQNGGICSLSTTNNIVCQCSVEWQGTFCQDYRATISAGGIVAVIFVVLGVSIGTFLTFWYRKRNRSMTMIQNEQRLTVAEDHTSSDYVTLSNQ